jgi:hypothetical protein
LISTVITSSPKSSRFHAGSINAFQGERVNFEFFSKKLTLSFKTAGYKPTFITGGVQPDTMRNFTGYAGSSSGEISGSTGALLTMGTPIKTGGVFTQETTGVTANQGGSNPILCNGKISIDPSLVVPTGPDNAPANLSTRFWRRDA